MSAMLADSVFVLRLYSLLFLFKISSFLYISEEVFISSDYLRILKKSGSPARRYINSVFLLKVSTSLVSVAAIFPLTATS